VNVIPAPLVVEPEAAAVNVVDPHPLLLMPEGLRLKLGNTILIVSPVTIKAFKANSK
jgi:hypothetical protein